jgi:hypothetical protein
MELYYIDVSLTHIAPPIVFFYHCVHYHPSRDLLLLSIASGPASNNYLFGLLTQGIHRIVARSNVLRHSTLVKLVSELLHLRQVIVTDHVSTLPLLLPEPTLLIQRGRIPFWLR